MRVATLTIALLSITVGAASGHAQTASARPLTTHYTSAQTPIGTLLADPSAKAAVARQFPELIASHAVASGMANRMTLRSLKRFRPNMFTDARLAALDADLAKLPVN